MRLGGGGQDEDFIDRTGQSGGGMSMLGGGGGILGMLIPLVLSRFGIVGILILAHFGFRDFAIGYVPD